MREASQEATVTLQGRDNGMEQGGEAGGEGKRSESGCEFEGEQADILTNWMRDVSTGLSEEQVGCGGQRGACRVGHRPGAWRGCHPVGRLRGDVTWAVGWERLEARGRSGRFRCTWVALKSATG